jgi:uncharacterized protein Yka (UPF0111/DUF47 family)
VDRPPGYEADVRELFTPFDRESMLAFFDLWEYDDVVREADAVLDSLETGRMPCTEPWGEDQVALFRRWIEGGMQP